jgi:hypothetical protein
MASSAHNAVVCVRRSRGLVRKFGCDVQLSTCGASFQRTCRPNAHVSERTVWAMKRFPIPNNRKKQNSLRIINFGTKRFRRKGDLISDRCALLATALGSGREKRALGGSKVGA